VADRLSASVLVMMLGVAFQPVLSSTLTLASRGPNQSSQCTPNAGNGIITGIVVNDRQEPVARALVQAFPADATVPRGQPRGPLPPLKSANGSASSDPEGRFQISGLEPGEYLVAAAPAALLPSGGSTQPAIYAATFHPSTIDNQQAVRVSAVASAPTTIQIQLVRVPGARVSGSVVSPSGRPTGGMNVRLFHRFGGFGAESNVAVVGAKGTFETPRLPPGWYRLTIGTRPPDSTDASGEFAVTLIEVQDRDLDGLSLVLGPGASISGRVVAEPAASVRTPIGLRVNASPTPDQFSMSRPITARVAGNWAFRMTGLSGSYQFTVSADRSPGVVATRISLDGVEAPASDGVAVADGTHDVIVFVAPREPPRPAVDKTLSSGALVELFKGEKVFWRQFAIGTEIVDRHDASVLPSLVGLLSHDDRHERGNAAFVFAGLGDSRGFQVITDILTDRSDRPEAQGIASASSDGRYRVARQIATDRYYAAHLLGDLRDPRAVPILVPLLKDPEVNSVVPWALGQIGGKGAIGPLLDLLDEDSPAMRVLAIYALETLDAKEALPRLFSLLNDHRRSNSGALVSVADAAKAAIAKLQ
jgi:hypothetical protein